MNALSSPAAVQLCVCSTPGPRSEWRIPEVAREGWHVTVSLWFSGLRQKVERKPDARTREGGR